MDYETFMKTLDNDEQVFEAKCPDCDNATFRLFILGDGETAVGIMCDSCQKFFPRRTKNADKDKDYTGIIGGIWG